MLNKSQNVRVQDSTHGRVVDNESAGEVVTDVKHNHSNPLAIIKDACAAADNNSSSSSSLTKQHLTEFSQTNAQCSIGVSKNETETSADDSNNPLKRSRAVRHEASASQFNPSGTDSANTSSACVSLTSSHSSEEVSLAASSIRVGKRDNVLSWGNTHLEFLPLL